MIAVKSDKEVYSYTLSSKHEGGGSTMTPLGNVIKHSFIHGHCNSECGFLEIELWWWNKTDNPFIPKAFIQKLKGDA